jgi:hypothetical protein
MIARYIAAQDSSPMQLDEFLELVRARRSARHFQPDPVSPELLDSLLEEKVHRNGW